MPRTAVVILNYNGRKYLSKFLPVLLKNTPEAEIVVADNHSTDDSIQFLETLPRIRVIKLDKNYGYAGGYNQALKQINTQYYVLLNSDVEVTPGWLGPLEKSLDQTNHAAVQPKILSFDQRSHFEYAGAAGGYLDQLGYPYCRGRIFNTLEKDTGQFDDQKEIFWASGACFIIRSEIFHTLGGFDSDFFAHMEEIDLCWRIHSSGRKILYNPASVVYHVGGGTLNKVSPFKTYLNFRNSINLLIKNLPIKQLIMVLPVRMVMDILAGLKLSFDNKSFHHLLAVLKAQKDSFLKIRKYLKKRGITSRPNGTKSIVWDYYIKRKKHFNNTK